MQSSFLGAFVHFQMGEMEKAHALAACRSQDLLNTNKNVVHEKEDDNKMKNNDDDDIDSDNKEDESQVCCHSMHRLQFKIL